MKEIIIGSKWKSYFNDVVTVVAVDKDSVTVETKRGNKFTFFKDGFIEIYKKIK